MPAARLPGLTLAFPALPYFAHSDVVHVSQRIAGRGSNRVSTDPRSWACILPAGECSSVRLVATAVQFAARAAASTRDPGAPPAWASARFCSSVKRGLPRVLVAQARNLPIGSCKRESRTTAMQCTLAAVKARSEWHVTSLYSCVRLQDAQHVGPDATGDPGGTPHHLFFSIAFAFLAGCLPVKMQPRLSTRMCVCVRY